MDTLSHIRKVKRFVESQNRKELKRKMDGYNGLASVRGGGEGLGEQQSPDTIHDISQSLAENIRMRNTRNRFVRRVSQVDRITAHVVCDEVRQTWNDKLHANQQLSDETRKKLVEQASSCSIGAITAAKQRDALRERNQRLTQLAAWMVHQWCETEGYDPALHTEDRRMSIKHVECKTKYECEHLHIV